MTKRTIVTGHAFGSIKRIGTDTTLSLGNRLQAIRHIKAAADEMERQLVLQLGADLAKHLFAAGIKPQGRPVGEILRGIDARTEVTE